MMEGRGDWDMREMERRGGVLGGPMHGYIGREREEERQQRERGSDRKLLRALTY
jgi:hypothetical protein